MVKTNVRCINCKSKDVSKYGKQTNGSPRLKCKNCGKMFQSEYVSNGAKPETKELIIKMSLNGSGIRDIARVLSISTNTVMSVLKKQKSV
jgi:transposase-like protein